MLKAEKTPGVSRTARSCQVLRQTMIRLLKEKELEKITVTELCLHAQINRSTFYEYYDDIHDLMNDIETNFLEKADQLCAYITAHVLPPETVTSLILNFISGEKETLSQGTHTAAGKEHRHQNLSGTPQCSGQDSYDHINEIGRQ